jgi:hypothetical protein
MARRLGHLNGDGSGRGVDLLGFVAIGVSQPLRCPLIVCCLQVLFSFNLHRQLKKLAENPRHAYSSVSDQIFHDRVNRRIVS